MEKDRGEGCWGGRVDGYQFVSMEEEQEDQGRKWI
jgi:hypothetical protein